MCSVMNMYIFHDLYCNIFTQVMIEGFKPHSEAVLAVDDISFSEEHCEEITSKYNRGASTIMQTHNIVDT